jgi:hypothetical protein
MAKTSVFGILQKVEEENFGVKNEALKRKKYQGRLRSKNKKKLLQRLDFCFFCKIFGIFSSGAFLN